MLYDFILLWWRESVRTKLRTKSGISVQNIIFFLFLLIFFVGTYKSFVLYLVDIILFKLPRFNTELIVYLTKLDIHSKPNSKTNWISDYYFSIKKIIFRFWREVCFLRGLRKKNENFSFKVSTLVLSNVSVC